MYCIISPYDNPYFNLASEEYLLKRFDREVFLLYVNQPSIVVGKHQNTMAEINFPWVQERDILVARRISGGGTVYHDEGNLNFAFFQTGREGDLVNYGRAMKPVLAALRDMGLKVRMGERNELLLKGKKISGTASHVYKDRVLHHGTLLFSSEMKDLKAALKTNQKPYLDRAVRSVSSPVTNISEHLDRPLDMEQFSQELLTRVMDQVVDPEIYVFSREDVNAIKQLRDERYATWEWNFGYSPRYRFTRELEYEKGSIVLKMNVEKGVIRELDLEGDFSSMRDISELEDRIRGCIHDPETLRDRLYQADVENYIEGMDPEMLLTAFF